MKNLNKSYPKMESQVYSIPDIQCLLSISRSAAYAYINKVYEMQEPFAVIKIGTSYRIPRAGFDRWLQGEIPKSVENGENFEN
jgi:predicted DNA-binding transcriptional regulator AlpA